MTYPLVVFWCEVELCVPVVVRGMLVDVEDVVGVCGIAAPLLAQLLQQATAACCSCCLLYCAAGCSTSCQLLGKQLASTAYHPAQHPAAVVGPWSSCNTGIQL